MQFYLYADNESAELLAAARPKALLIGSDFGYGNFGDVLQHLGAVKLVRAWTDLAVVSLFMLEALSRQVDAASLRKSYGVDALLFASEAPIKPDEAARLGLRLTHVVCNVSFVYLYGGGYLNEMWGDSVLQPAEQFLGQLVDVPYVISGQQLSAGFVQQTREHVEKFRPRLVGMRDSASLDRAIAGGMPADFSFDDAVEQLLELHRKLDLREGDGAFLHLNTSGYTGNDAALAEMAAHLRLVATRVGSSGHPVLFQAFQDAREAVVDSIETVKRLETGFPFSDIETALLVRAILGDEDSGAPRVLTGRFGYSSSYHVTLWLQLRGIPCWLRGSNKYYEQKRKALDIEGRFEDFLERMQCPDHGENLRARALWLDKLQQVMVSIKPATNRIEWELPDDGVPTRQFHFKGEPRFEQQVREAWKAYEDGQHEITRLGAALEDASARLTAAEASLAANRSETDILRVRLEEHASERASLLSRIEATAEERGELKVQLLGVEGRANELGQLLVDRQQRVMEQDGLLEEARASLHVCSEQLAAAENDARHHRDERARAHAELQDAWARAHELSERLQACSEQLTAMGDELQRCREEYAQAQADLQAAAIRESELSERLQACSEQLTIVGNDARYFREECSRAHVDLQAGLARENELSERLQACSEQLTVVGDDAQHYREECAQTHAGLQRALVRENELSERLLACNEQLTIVGHDARHYRDEYSSTHASLQDVSARERELSAQLQVVLQSRSWRWTRWMRVGNRFVRTGRFDPAGQVGWFGAAQIVGRKLPVPGRWRSALGRLLRRWRRR